jgi:acetolactate synthase I/III small subunit
VTPPAGGHVPGADPSGIPAPVFGSGSMPAPSSSAVPSSAGGSAPRHHIVTALVENKPAVLTRVASLFSRRGFNIFSLAVAPTDNVRFSRITIVVDVESAPLEQIMKQLDKLINVVSISELAPDEAVEREMLLVTLAVSAGAGGSNGAAGVQSQVTALVESFGASIVDEGSDQMTVMLAGPPSRIDEFENLVRPFGITELQRTGLVALPKLSPGAAPGAGDNRYATPA